jgi:hypothetical protein
MHRLVFRFCNIYFDKSPCSDYLKCTNFEDDISDLCKNCSHPDHRINVPVCEDQSICFCEECSIKYREEGF